MDVLPNNRRLPVRAGRLALVETEPGCVRLSNEEDIMHAYLGQCFLSATVCETSEV
jgi:hypothetical protein